MSPTGIVLGATFAALFALTWWPWAFFTLAIVLGITVFIASTVLPDLLKGQGKLVTGSVKTTFHRYFVQLDVAGAVTGVLGLVLFNFSWNQAVLTGWQAHYVYVILILGSIFMVGFIFIEMHVSTLPLIPREALNHDTAFILGCVACAWGHIRDLDLLYLARFRNRKGSLALFCQWLEGSVTVTGFIAALTTAVILNRLHPSWGDGDCSCRIHCRHRSPSNYARTPDMLGSTLRMFACHAVGDGHELSRGDIATVGPYGQGTSGRLSESVNTVVNLQYLAGVWLRRCGGKRSQQGAYRERKNSQGIRRGIVSWGRTVRTRVAA